MQKAPIVSGKKKFQLSEHTYKQSPNRAIAGWGQRPESEVCRPKNYQAPTHSEDRFHRVTEN
jgi:hypothetical protein